MFAPTAYLRWAAANYGKASFDLGRSGISGTDGPAFELPADMERFSAWEVLRARIAAYNGVSVEETIPALGTSHALWVAYASLLTQGDEALVESVTYEPIHRIVDGIGAHVKYFARSAKNGFALDPAEVERALTPRTRVVALSSLHNPSGVRIDDGALREVARIAARHSAHVVVDEVYAPFESLCDARGAWGQSARRLAPNLVAVGSLTKCYGLGAHRVGWVLGHARRHRACRRCARCQLGSRSTSLDGHRSRRLRAAPGVRRLGASHDGGEARAGRELAQVATPSRMEYTSRRALRLRHGHANERRPLGTDRARHPGAQRHRRAGPVLRRRQRLSTGLVDREREARPGAGERLALVVD